MKTMVTTLYRSLIGPRPNGHLSFSSCSGRKECGVQRPGRNDGRGTWPTTEHPGKRPGVLVVHEWWGLNDYARKRARMLRSFGYTALAVDMYGGDKVAAHPEDAAKLSSELMKNFDTAKARFIAAMDLLKRDPIVDATRDCSHWILLRRGDSP